MSKTTTAKKAAAEKKDKTPRWSGNFIVRIRPNRCDSKFQRAY